MGRHCRVVQAAVAAGQEWGETPGRAKAELNSNTSIIWPLEMCRFLMQPWKDVLALRQLCFTLAEVKRQGQEALTSNPTSTKPQSHVVFGHVICPVPLSKAVIIWQDLYNQNIFVTNKKWYNKIRKLYMWKWRYLDILQRRWGSWSQLR